MAKYLKTKQPEHKAEKRKPNTSGTSNVQYLRKVRKNIYRQAMLALLTVVLTIVILFAMTSAWYTNIVQTSGLVFEAEAWGFDGTITVNDSSIVAAPGDEGVVHLTVENSSDSISAVSVNVSKNEMQEEMKQRLFFYVDTSLERNGETMERVYLNKYEGYTYDVFSKSQLTLTEQVSNAPVIKWQWVYDVLGYYVLGQPYTIEKTNEIENADGTVTAEIVSTTQMSVKEYLRPIEYNFDDATTVVQSNNNNLSVEIATVDGVTTPELFLYQLSKTDGYDGEIGYDDKQSFGNYYAVDVDENGYGVYAYLCNYAEIKMATDYDTMLGEISNKRAKGMAITEQELALMTHTAKLTLSAQKIEGTTVSANTLGTLRNAINLNIASIIQLSSNITIPEGEALTIPADTRVMLDLNGHTITNLDGTAIKAEPGSYLTMLNGSITNITLDEAEASSKTYGIYATGAEVVMSDVDITDFQYGVFVGDHENSNELDSRVYMAGCDVNAKSYAVFVSGNGILSDRRSQLVIENCKLSSEGIVLTGSGDSSGTGRWGTDIQVINSTIIADTNDKNVQGCGIYHPQKNSSLTVYNSVVEGYNGIAIKGGSVDIVGSTVRGMGAYQEPRFEGNGFTDTGDAVYVETSYGYLIELNISNGSILTHSDPQSRSLRVFDEKSTVVMVNIESGTFDEEQPEAYIARNSEQSIVSGKAVVSALQ